MPYLLTDAAGGFAVSRVRNETQQYTTALKSAGQSPVGLLPLYGFGSAVLSFQLHPFSVPSRTECRQVTPCRASSASGTKAGTTSKTFFKLRTLSFCFLSQRPRLAAFGGSIAQKTPVLKLNRPFSRKPPAAIASESTRVACASCAKPQLTGLRYRWSKGVVSGGLLMS